MIHFSVYANDTFFCSGTSFVLHLQIAGFYTKDTTNYWGTSKKILSHCNFQAQVASSLILVNADRKCGQITRSPVLLGKQKVSNSHCRDVRKDKIAHWPKKFDKRRRCRLCKINNTNTVCSKWNVRLCFAEGRNCFVDFHAKNI